MQRTIKIAIIGGGASGTITAIHLLNEFKGPLKIYLLEKRQKGLFRGHAYSSELEVELLNVPAGKMSIFSDHPLDFYHWLKAKQFDLSGKPITTDSFVSRRWFGDYLSERLVEAKAKSTGSSFESVVSETIDISLDKKSNRYKVKMLSGEDLDADYLIFATGNEPPADILNSREKAILGKKYIADPWTTDPFGNLTPDDDVLILGSGLSMVDHALSLYIRKHKGKVYSFSRHGHIPLPQLIGQDGKVNFDKDASDLLNVLRQLRSTISEAEKQGLQWQQIINALRDDTPAIWQRLSVPSRRIFLNRLKHFWETHRHRMPHESAQLLEEMKLAGKFELLAGRRKEISSANGTSVFQFIPKGGSDIRSINVNYVINCIGPSGDYTKCSNGLITSLLTKGWMKQDELKLGITTGANGEIIMADGNPLPNTYAIGPLRKATEWESTAIREIKMQAEQLALDIALNYPESHAWFIAGSLNGTAAMGFTQK